MVQFNFLDELLGLLQRNVTTDSVQDDVQLFRTDSPITICVEQFKSLDEVLDLLDGELHLFSKGFLINFQCTFALKSRTD